MPLVLTILSNLSLNKIIFFVCLRIKISLFLYRIFLDPRMNTAFNLMNSVFNIVTTRGSICLPNTAITLHFTIETIGSQFLLASDHRNPLKQLFIHFACVRQVTCVLPVSCAPHLLRCHFIPDQCHTTVMIRVDTGESTILRPTKAKHCRYRLFLSQHERHVFVLDPNVFQTNTIKFFKTAISRE